MSKPSRRKKRQARKSSPKHRLNKQERRELKNKRHQNLPVIREIKNDMDAKIMPRTQAHNRKSQADTIEQQRLEHEAIFEVQMKVWLHSSVLNCENNLIILITRTRYTRCFLSAMLPFCISHCCISHKYSVV